MPNWWAGSRIQRLKEAVAPICGRARAATKRAAHATHAYATHSAKRAKRNAADLTAKGRDIVKPAFSGVIAGTTTGFVAFADYARNLDWSTITPTEFLDKFVTAGTRGVDRTIDGAREVWERIPEDLRALGPEEVAARLWGSESAAERFDWSHIVPHRQGGGSEASNGIFELASLNRSRGGERMQPHEIDAAQQVLADVAFKAAVEEVATQALAGAGVAAVVACVLSCMEDGLEYQRGRISRDELVRRIGQAVARSALVGSAVAGILVIVALAFPPLIPIAAPLVGPVALLGLCVVGGKVVRLGMEWIDLYREAFGNEVPGKRWLARDT